MAVIRKAPFYFLRHGVTAANLADIMCGGDWNLGLHARGVLQAQAARADLAALDPRPARIVASPMLRARETTVLINAGLGLPVQLDEGLREWRIGGWEGAPWPEVKPDILARVNPPSGEPTHDFERRILNAVDRVLAVDSSIPLLVSHGAVAHVLFSALALDVTFIENCRFYWIAPCESRWVATPVRSSRSAAA